MPTPSNIHDTTFHALMSNREFAIGFFKTYLPADIVKRIDFKTLKLFNLSGKVVSEKDQTVSQTDVVHSVKLDGNDLLLWCHFEHQTRPEKFMPVRATHYQCGKLLEYAKLNKCDKLPPIITIIYHQGIKPYTYSVDLNELFSDQELAKQYFAKPILVDLPAMKDEDIKSHEGIGAAEMLLKYIRSKQFAQNYRAIIQEMAILGDKTRHILIQYLIQRADIDEQLLLQAINDELPQDKEIAMTVAEQIAKRNLQQGIQQGIQETAKNMLLKGYDDAEIIALTGLTSNVISELKTKH